MSKETKFDLSSRIGQEKAAMASIYGALTYADMKESIDVEKIVSSICLLPYEDCPYFVKSMLVLALKYYDEAVEAFQKYLTKWEFPRLNRVAQAIFLLSYVHYYKFEEKPEKAVAIDVAVSLAKDYLAEKDYRYINAVLDKALV